jgi:hypothetical protein
LKEITDQKRNGFEPQGAYIFDNISYAPLPVCINFEEIDIFCNYSAISGGYETMNDSKTVSTKI